MRATFLVLMILSVVPAVPAVEIPAHPQELVFEPLHFEVPDPAAMRFSLDDGTIVFAKADRQLPLVTLQMYFRGGQYLEPEGKEGLAALAGEAWREGGAGERTARQLDEDLDHLAAVLRTSLGDVTGSVTLDVPSKDLEPAMALLMDLLVRPRFQEDRFLKAKDDLVQAMRTRNDSTAAIELREWQRLLYGEDYWLNRLPTASSVEAITADDCRAFVHRVVRRGNLVVAVAGDFEMSELRALLSRTIGTLPALGAPLPDVPQPTRSATPGVYMIDKPDVNQGHVLMGHLGYRFGNPLQIALEAVNRVLGGGDFTSRIVKRVRSDEGLAYSAYSQITFPATMPGEFYAAFQSKSSTCAYAASITNDLIREIRAEPVSEEELSTTVNYFIEVFPRYFESPTVTTSRFAVDELLGRPEHWWANYRQRVAALTSDRLLEAAREGLHPDRMVVLVVGNLDEMMHGHPEHEARFQDLGELHRLPLRDPLTLEPMTDTQSVTEDEP